MVLHYPIGFLTMAVLLEFWHAVRPSDETRRIQIFTIVLSLLSGLTAAGLGILRASGSDYDPHSVEMHRWFGMMVPVFTLTTLLVERRAYRTRGRMVTGVYRLLLGATLCLLVVAGHLGGNLTHGSTYLTQHAPGFLQKWLEPQAGNAATAAKQTGGHNEKTSAAATVALLFEKKCVPCHGPEKRKGGYRIDQQELALKPGDSGKQPIKPGAPTESHLLRLLLLPRDDDDAMPPKGKSQLTAEEVLMVARWIHEGAAFPSATARIP